MVQEFNNSSPWGKDLGSTSVNWFANVTLWTIRHITKQTQIVQVNWAQNAGGNQQYPKMKIWTASVKKVTRDETMDYV